jgi:sugar phosphate permease
MGQGKLEPGYSICEKTTAHWAWEIVGVACTLLAGWRSTVLLGSTDRFTLWRICGNGVHMHELSATYVVWLEILS